MHMSSRPAPLREAFGTSRLHNPDAHRRLQPGSILFGYPDSAYGQGVFLLTYLDPAQNFYTALQLNGEQCTTLSVATKHCLQIDLPPELDAPVLTGGAVALNSMTILTPRDWLSDANNHIDVGPYRLHAGLEALRAIATGNRPSFMCLFCGKIQGRYAELHVSLQTNELGEIAPSDDIVFTARGPEGIWRKAMDVHTGGKPLFIPAPYQERSLIPREETPPTLYRN